MVEKIIYFGDYHRIVLDEAVNTWKCQWYNSDIGNWENIINLVHKPLNYDMILPVIFETDTGDLAADTIDTPYISKDVIPSLIKYIENVAIEATWTATETDSETKIGVFDETSNAYVCAVSGNVGTNVKSNYAKIIEGNKHTVHIEVTTASGVSGATTKVKKAIIYIRLSVV